MSVTRRPRTPLTGTQRTANLLLLAGCPLVFWFLRGSVADIVAASAFLTLLFLARHFLTKGVRQVGQPRKREVPFRLSGAVVLGLLVAMLTLYRTGVTLVALSLGLLAFVLAVLAFGSERLSLFRSSGAAGRNGRAHSAKKVMRGLETLRDKALNLNDPLVMRRVEELRDGILSELNSVGTDPRHAPALLQAAMPLLVEAEAAFARFVAAPPAQSNRSRQEALLASLEDLLDDFEEAAARIERGMQDDREAHLDDMLSRMDREIAA